MVAPGTPAPESTAPETPAPDTPETAPGACDPHDPPLRVMALHALLYCPRLFYLEEVEEIRVADRAVYAGRELHASLESGEGDDAGEWTSLALENPRLGIKGKVDCLRRRDGRLIPYEHKRGRAMRDAAPQSPGVRRSGSRARSGVSSRRVGGKRRADAVAPGSAPPDPATAGSPGAWPSDRVQVGAYALLIEDAFGQPVPEGRVRYHAENVTVRVPIDDALRTEVRAAIAEARRLRATIVRPPICDNERKCASCSLAPVCLPEETRHLRDERREPVRLFPPDDQRSVLHVMAQGASVARSAERLVIRAKSEDGGWLESQQPIQETSGVILHGHAQISTQALRLCIDHDVPVHWLTYGGRYLAGLTGGPGGVQRRLRQYAALSDVAVCLRLTRSLVHARIQGQHRFLLRATRDRPEARARIDPAMRAIGQSLAAVARAENADTLRGLEGESAARYLPSLNALLAERVPAELRYDVRTRRPPRDRFNALLSYGYGLLHTAVTSAVLAVGLEPALGFFHRPRSAAHPLVLDLIELFRVPLWDLVVIGSLNRGQWDPLADFDAAPAAVWLSNAGRRKAIGLFESRLQEQWKHPVLRYSLSYRRTIELETRLLEKEWSGEPGLFARARLR